MNQSIIQIKNLKKVFKIKQKEPGFVPTIKSFFSPKYKHITAVDDISLSIDSGEAVAFIGPNGAGKSTTIKMLTGILFPSSGEISVLGLDPAKKRGKLAYKIGSVFGQKSQLWYHLPPIDTFLLLSKIYEIKKSDYKERLNFLIDVFELEDLINTPVRQLSLGQRMRCEIAGSLLHRPKIIFLDEPTIGLDIIAKQQVRDVLKLLNEKEGVTIFLTSHDVGDIEAIAQRTIIINHGQIVFDDNTEKLRTRYITSKIVEIIFEEPTEKFVFEKGRIVEGDTRHIKIEIDSYISTLESLLKYTLENFKVRDINIVTPPLEDIISKIYTTNV